MRDLYYFVENGEVHITNKAYYDEFVSLNKVGIEPEVVVVEEGIDCLSFIFEENQKVKKAILPKSLEYIGHSAFCDCWALEEVVVQSDIVSIDALAFYCCENLKSFEIPSSVRQIGDSAFLGCSSLESIVIPDSIKEIREHAFDMCESLKSIVIPSKCKKIGIHAFSYCEKLESLYISALVEKIDETSFKCCDNLKTIIVDPDNKTFDSRNDCNAIIKSESDELILACKTTVIPEGIKSIGHYAFFNCKQMESLHIPASVIKIHPKGIYLKNRLRSITVDPNNPAYDSRDNCNAIIKTDENELILGCANTIFPNTVTAVGYHALAFCDGDVIKVGDSVKKIKKEAFFCSNFKEITLPASVKTIGMSAFNGCEQLKSIVLPPLLRNINTELFVDCKSLKKMIFPSGLKKIGERAFEYCEKLESVFIPASVNMIDSSAFSYCKSLKEICIDQNNPIYDSRENCNAIIESKTDTLIIGTKSSFIPESVKALGKKAFCDCEIKEITIPSQVEVIPVSAFSGCYELKKVVLPPTIKRIEKWAFAMCADLVDINIPDSIEYLDDKAFLYCSKLDLKSLYMNYENQLKARQSKIDKEIEEIGEMTRKYKEEHPLLMKGLSNKEVVDEIDEDTENDLYALAKDQRFEELFNYPRRFGKVGFILRPEIWDKLYDCAFDVEHDSPPMTIEEFLEESQKKSRFGEIFNCFNEEE